LYYNFFFIRAGEETSKKLVLHHNHTVSLILEQVLQVASNFNPLTYSVDALRTVTLGDAWQPVYPLYYDLLLIVLFDISMMIIGTIAPNRRR